MIPVGEKVPISYLALGIYITFMVVSLLLVGLLPPLVNRPECKPKPSQNLPDVVDVAPPRVQVVEQPRKDNEVKLRSKRSVKGMTPEAVQLVEDQKKRAQEAYERNLKTSPLFARLVGNRQPKAFPTCPEIMSPSFGVEYPWYEVRLPSYLQAVNYNLEILLDQLDISDYTGFINITFNVNDTQPYILLHNGINDTPNLIGILDNNGNSVPINCVANFPYLRNDYFIIKPQTPLAPGQGPYIIEFLFVDFYTGVENGFRATFDLTIYHRSDFVALFNTPAVSSNPEPGSPDILATKFVTTPPMPVDYIALSVFNRADYGSITKNTSRTNIPVTIWARQQFIANNYALDPLDMALAIFDGVADVLRGVNNALPPKIDILVVPKYPVHGIGHFGLPILEEKEVLFNRFSSTGRDREHAAMLIGRVFAEFWFGNFMSQRWWDELWTMEGFAEYVKYRGIDEAFPEFSIMSHFIPTELIETLLLDGYPSSHPIQKPINNPYEIEEYFDLVETVKAAAILRMVENEFNFGQMVQALNNYLNANPWGVGNINDFYSSFGTFGNGWNMADFFDRWTIQPNYPVVQVELVGAGAAQQIQFTQIRGLNSNSSYFSGENLYPSPWNWTWFIPIDCSFGNATDNGGAVREREYYLDTQTGTFNVPIEPGVTEWTWVHCDRKFVGFYETQYTDSNWNTLGQAMKQKNTEFTPEDRAQIVHNLFLNAFAERSTYGLLRNVLEYLTSEFDYLPWRTVWLHAEHLTQLLVYRQTFYEFSEFLTFVLRQVELQLNVWDNTGGSHVDELFKETIISLACHLQDPICLQTATNLWPTAALILTSANFVNTSIPAYARHFVYYYHMENTYNVDDWDMIFRDFVGTNDLFEQKKLIMSLTFSRLPWLIVKILEGAGDDYIKRIDYFQISAILSLKPLGREMAWDRYRGDFNTLLEDYGEDDPRIGWLLVEITESFETEFLFYELLQFVFYTTTGAAANARYKALEIVSTNLDWIIANERELQCAFSIFGCSSKSINPLLEFHLESKREAFRANARAEFKRLLKETKLEMFDELKKKLL